MNLATSSGNQELFSLSLSLSPGHLGGHDLVGVAPVGPEEQHAVEAGLYRGDDVTGVLGIDSQHTAVLGREGKG